MFFPFQKRVDFRFHLKFWRGYTATPLKTTMTGWKIPMFNRISTSTQLVDDPAIVMLVFGGGWIHPQSLTAGTWKMMVFPQGISKLPGTDFQSPTSVFAPETPRNLGAEVSDGKRLLVPMICGGHVSWKLI